MRADEFDYHLPPERIAQRPLPVRDASRLLVLDRASGRMEDRQFRDFPELLRGNELLVLNNARVIPARLFGRRARTPADGGAGGPGAGLVEVFLARQIDSADWDALVRPGRKLPVGERIVFAGGELEARILTRGERGLRQVRFLSRDSRSIAEHLERLGHVPLPPYIDRQDESADRERYQTVFASHPGAVAAPTAGLHFTEETLQRIRARGPEISELTLDVGLGTFQPIHSERLEDHRMHEEQYEIPGTTARAIEEARRAGRAVVAVGTTVVRALEDSALKAQRAGGSGPVVLPGKAGATLFMTPGFQFRVVDALLTNFHLPRSTLLALVCAFAGRDRILDAYRHAVESGYRFYSYGDCMLIR